MTAAKYFDKIAKAAEANPEEATSPNAIFQFELSGDGGGTYVLNLTQGTTSNFLSTEPNPDAGATIHVSAEDWDSIMKGDLNAMQAFMAGKIKVDGDMTLAMNLPNVMKLASD